MECTEHKIHRTTHKAGAILYFTHLAVRLYSHLRDILFSKRDFIELFVFVWSLHAKRAA